MFTLNEKILEEVKDIIGQRGLDAIPFRLNADGGNVKIIVSETLEEIIPVHEMLVEGVKVFIGIPRNTEMS